MDVPVCGHSILFGISLLTTIHINMHDVLIETITLLLIILFLLGVYQIFCIRWC